VHTCAEMITSHRLDPISLANQQRIDRHPSTQCGELTLGNTIFETAPSSATRNPANILNEMTSSTAPIVSATPQLYVFVDPTSGTAQSATVISPIQNAPSSHTKQLFGCGTLTTFPCIAIPICLVLATAIFLIGVLEGPMWLICVGVAIAVSTMVCSLYIYTMSKQIQRRQSRTSLLSLSSRSESLSDHYAGVLTEFRRCIVSGFKLPTYNEAIRRRSVGESFVIGKDVMVFVFKKYIIDDNTYPSRI